MEAFVDICSGRSAQLSLHIFVIQFLRYRDIRHVTNQYEMSVHLYHRWKEYGERESRWKIEKIDQEASLSRVPLSRKQQIERGDEFPPSSISLYSFVDINEIWTVVSVYCNHT